MANRRDIQRRQAPDARPYRRASSSQRPLQQSQVRVGADRRPDTAAPDAYERRRASRRRAASAPQPRQTRPQPRKRRAGNMFYIFFLVIIAVVAVTAIAWLLGRGGPNAVDSNSYDWSRLERTDGRYVYTAEDGSTSKLGVDVSYHNGAIDWQAVANDGMEFAYVRVGWRGYGEGQIKEDSRARENIAGVKETGMGLGLYFFSQAITEEEAVEEADFVCGLADEFGLADYAGTLPIAFDMEENNIRDERIAELTVEQSTNIALAFCRRVKERGYEPMVYGNNVWFTGYYNLEHIAREAQLWLANYSAEPDAYYDFAMWQYASDGHVEGISTIVDMDLLMPRPQDSEE